MNETSGLDLPVPFEDRAHEALIGVWWTAQLLTKESQRFFRAWHISDAQFNVMMVVRYAERPLTQKDIGERLLVDKSNVTGLVTRMVARGWLHRDHAPSDGRRMRVALTAAGIRLMDEIEPLYQRKVSRLMAGLTPDEWVELTRLTRKLREGMAGEAGGHSSGGSAAATAERSQ